MPARWRLAGALLRAVPVLLPVPTPVVAAPAPRAHPCYTAAHGPQQGTVLHGQRLRYHGLKCLKIAC